MWGRYEGAILIADMKSRPPEARYLTQRKTSPDLGYRGYLGYQGYQGYQPLLGRGRAARTGASLWLEALGTLGALGQTKALLGKLSQVP